MGDKQGVQQGDMSVYSRYIGGGVYSRVHW